MSGWIDCRGVRKLFRYCQTEGRRLDELARKQEGLHPLSRKAAKYRARRDDIGRVMAMLQSMVRPATELPPPLRGYRGNSK